MCPQRSWLNRCLHLHDVSLSGCVVWVSEVLMRTSYFIEVLFLHSRGVGEHFLQGLAFLYNLFFFLTLMAIYD